MHPSACVSRFPVVSSIKNSRTFILFNLQFGKKILLKRYSGSGMRSKRRVEDGYKPISVVCSTENASTIQDSQKRSSTKTLISRAYTDFDSLQYGIGSYAIPDEDKKAMKEMSALQGPKAWTYGEITFEGVAALGQHIRASEGLSQHQEEDGEDDHEESKDKEGHIFYDLGSGLGRMVIQVFFDWEVSLAVGVELSQHRHARATRAMRQLQPVVQACAPRQLAFRNENLLDADMCDATIVYLACTCWDTDFMEEVLNKLQTLPRLQWVISTECFSKEFGLDVKWCPLHSQLQLPMSWDEDWPVYIYKVQRNS